MYQLTRRAIATLIVCAAALAGCARTGTGPEKLTIADAQQPAFALLYVADARGFLREAGLDVTFRKFRLGRDALTSVIEGEADVATVYEMPVVTRIYEGKPLGILTTLHASTRNTGLVARRDRGIAAPADLVGKRIGVARGTNAEYFLSVFLATQGIAAQGVTIAYVEPPDFERVLLGGEVDALALFEPFQGRLRDQLGERAVSFHSDAYIDTSMLVGMRAVVARRPEAMRRLVAAIVKAEDYIASNPGASIAIVTARLGEVTTEPAIRAAWPDFRREARLDNVLLATLALEGQWMKDSGRFPGGVPDFRAALAPDALLAARPERVTVRGAANP